MSQIQFDYPYSYLILCGFLALGLSLFLYYRDSRWKEKPSYIPIGLGIVRTILFFILSILLLSPFLTYFDERTESPLLIFAVDNSESIQLTPEETLNEFRNTIDQWPEPFQSYDMEMLTIGSDVQQLDSLTFTDQQTNLSDLFNFVNEQYAGRTIGGLILASDGLYNIGLNPIYAQQSEDYPIYAIGLGDTTIRQDAKLKQVFHNEIAYLGDRFMVQADVEALEMNGLRSKIQLLRKRNNQFQVIQEKEVVYQDANFFSTTEFLIDAEEKGLQQYRVRVLPLTQEVSVQNNTKDFYIDIIDGRQKILVAAAQPHPDISALRQILDQYGNYEVELKLLKTESKKLNPDNYDLLILHQLPSKEVDRKLQNQLLNSKQPKLFIVGRETDIRQFNKAQKLLKVEPMNGQFNVVDAAFHNNFNAFQLDKELTVSIENYPPLEALFAKFKSTGRLNTLYYQQIGDLVTEYPLLSVGEEQNVRMGFICAEGIWRWRLYDYIEDQEHDALNILLDQVIKYLSIKEDRRQFKVRPAAQLFDENESVQFRAELFNDSYEPVNDADVSMSIIDENNKEYSFLFSRVNGFYSLNAGFLPPGNYRYTAESTRNGETYRAKGSFSVEKIQLEQYQTQANTEILQTIAAQSGGKFLRVADLPDLQSIIDQSSGMKDVLYTTARTKGFIDLKWVFWIIFLLLSIEWVSRRIAGTY